jgi:hypothetical protein
MAPVQTGSWAASARGLYLVAMGVFVVTVSIGIANGLDAVEFDRNAILTHVHSGTLGWITLTLVATAAWLYRSMDRRLAITLGVLVPVYVAGFYTTFFGLRAITGTLLLIAIAWLVAWAWGAYRSGERTTPRLAVALALTMFALGSLLGVLIQIGFATAAAIVPGDSVGAHASTQVFGYVVVAAMGIIEWVVLDPRGISRGAVVQIGALVVGAVVLMLGLLTGTTMIAGLVYLLAGIIGVGVFAVRIWPSALRTDWMRAGPVRAAAIASVWIVVALILYMVVIGQFIVAEGDVNKVNIGILTATDHSVFIGTITNLMLGFTFALAARGRVRWASADQVVFWAMNGGLIVFVIGLMANSAELKRIGAPVMGLAILIGLAVAAARLWRLDTADAEAGPSPAAAAA